MGADTGMAGVVCMPAGGQRNDSVHLCLFCRGWVRWRQRASLCVIGSFPSVVMSHVRHKENLTDESRV